MATWSWAPWVVLAVESAWREGGRKIFIAAIAGALQMLAGGPEIIFFTWLVLLALWIQQLIINEFPRTAFWRFPVMVALVAALAAAQLLPFLDLSAHSQRQAGYADLRWSMPGRGWANYLVPMAFGRQLGEGIFFQYGQFWTSSYYLGLGTLWLALLAIWKARNRRVYLLAAVATVAIVFALGGNTPIFPALRNIFPEFGFVTYPVKYLLLITFVSPLLAAFALARLREQNLSKQTTDVGIVLFLLLSAVLVWQWRFPLPPDDVHASVMNGFSRAAFLLGTAIVLFFLIRKSDSSFHRYSPLLLIFVAWLDVLTHEPAQNPTVPPNIYEPNLARQQLAMQPQPELGGSRAMVSPKAYRDFIDLAIRDSKNNFLAKRLGYCANANLLDAVPKVDGFFSLTTRENNDLFTLMYGTTNFYGPLEDFVGVSQITAPGEIFDWQPRTNFLPLVTAGQKPIYFDDTDTLHALTAHNFDGSKMVFLPPSAKSLVTVTDETQAKVLDSKFETQSVDINVDASAPSLVVIAQTYYHNWHALVDGIETPILRANYGFQAVEVSQGKHHIQLVYRDRAFKIGAIFSTVAGFICLFGCFIPRQRPT